MPENDLSNALLLKLKSFFLSGAILFRACLNFAFGGPPLR
jgi:hypothetical protein